MNRRRLLVVLCALPALPALAHHGWSEYDSGRLLKLTGKVREAGYEHPHGYVRLEVPGMVWLCVLAPPSRMQNRGLESGMLKAGVVASVEGYPNRSKPGEMRAERITVASKTVELR